MKVLVALTILQIATRIACIPTTAYVISSYSNVRLQQPSVDSLTPSVESRKANDIAILSLEDEPSTTQVIDKIESVESEKKLNNDKFHKLDILESSTVTSGIKEKEEELLVAKIREEVIENVAKSLIDNLEITTEVETTTLSDSQDENQPTTMEPTN